MNLSKILIYGDPHFVEYSSIVRKRGEKYSKRLENLINSLNWVEQTAEDWNCAEIICLGDFFDKSELSATELTALQEVGWANILHTYLVGNHEGMLQNLSTSSAHLFKSIPQTRVIDEPTVDFYHQDISLCFIPYILEEERESFDHYVYSKDGKPIIVCSHNDIKGINFGYFESKEGFNIEDIESQCTLFFNGHLHNGTQICRNGYNVGNLTGQNFSEDAFKYQHRVCILDTVTLEMIWIENPFAFNFYKIDVSDVNTAKTYIQQVKDNAIVTIKAPEDIVADIRALLVAEPRIKEYRVVSVPVKKELENGKDETVIQSVNHLEQFVTYIKDNLELTDTIISELTEVCGCN